MKRWKDGIHSCYRFFVVFVFEKVCPPSLCVSLSVNDSLSKWNLTVASVPVMWSEGMYVVSATYSDIFPLISSFTRCKACVRARVCAVRASLWHVCSSCVQILRALLS